MVNGVEMKLLIPVLLLALPAHAHVGNRRGRLVPHGSIDELLKSSTHPRHVRRNVRDDQAMTVSSEYFVMSRRNLSYKSDSSFLNKRIHRHLKEDDSEDDKSRDDSSRDEHEHEGRSSGHRSWGAASGHAQGGYHASGYNNGYYAGSYNESALTFVEYGPSGDHSYIGCLGLSDYELQHEWKFSGSPPSCTYVHHSNKKRTKKKRRKKAKKDAAASCQKHGWFSKCKSSSSGHNHTSWTEYYQSMAHKFSNSGHPTNGTNETFFQDYSSTYDGPDGEGGPEQEGEEREGEGNEGGPDEEKGDENDEADDDLLDDDSVPSGSNDEGDDDTVISNTDYEDVNGNEYVYEQSSHGNNKTHWWNNWNKKASNSTTNETQTDAVLEEEGEPQNNENMEGQQDGAGEEDAAEQDMEPEGFDPYDDFELELCDTYENLWLWDLSLTCKNSKSLEACECTYAEELMFEGTITCDDFILCPSDCSVCRTCSILLGCVQSYHKSSSTEQTGGLGGVIVGALMFAVVGGIGYFVVQRRRNPPSELSAHLMWKEIDSRCGSETGSDDHGAWPPSNTNHGNPRSSTDDFQLFEDYYKSIDEGDVAYTVKRHSGDEDSMARFTAIQINRFGDTDTISGIITNDGESIEGNNDDSSEASDGSTALSCDETGAQRIWLAPVDVKLNHSDGSESS